ncbi:phosphoadenosine phosphosulfate reductase [Azorhizobium oxalatiphilum]|uniref:Adenosine 5'-phosphosulfate reductase n=1 Tax=Azorhizobium oxalatiphilum TaxID=980631 RepID=A0A917F279_9HYPH|nr:phosphoadenylyl-sulfate reductase [Azorhizobium oxalatiphilum]GGF45653.1 phosphoadenosine phosphosulfate reductase [Azorhizobium oxalatiphilum]
MDCTSPSFDPTAGDLPAEADARVETVRNDLRREPAGDDIAALARRLEGAGPLEVMAQAVAAHRGRIAAVSSFGTESVVLLHMLAQVDPSVPVLFLDTGHLFTETLDYRDALIARLGLTDVRTFRPDEALRAARDPDNDLWASDTDACCDLRKVEPLGRALAPFDAWINGRKRYQAATRAAIPFVEQDDGRVKYNPLAALGPEEIAAWMTAHDLPQHPLQHFGFSSIGCMPCTSRAKPGEDARAGRWRGQAKTECGIHVRKDSPTM